MEQSTRGYEWRFHSLIVEIPLSYTVVEISLSYIWLDHCSCTKDKSLSTMKRNFELYYNGVLFVPTFFFLGGGLFVCLVLGRFVRFLCDSVGCFVHFY